MEKKSNNALKAGIWYTVSNFFVKGISFLLMPIFTRIMSGSDIGYFSNITSWFNILAIITSFELFSSISIARFDYKKELNSYISSTLFLGTVITLIFYLIVLMFHAFFEDLLTLNFETLNIIFIYLLFYPAIEMFQIRNQIKYDYIPTVILSISSSLLSSILSIVFTIVFTNQLRGRIYGYFMPLIIFSICTYIYLMLKGKRISRKYWKYALMISFPLIWHLLAGNLLSSADKVMITKMVSPEANALYSVSYTISTIVSILWTSMNNAWSPWAYQKMDEKKYDELYKKSKPYFICFFAIVLCFMIITPELLLIMGGKDYIDAKYVMPPVMIGYVFQFVYSLYVNIEFYHKKQKYIAIGTIIAAATNILLNIILIPIFGYIAAAYTTLVGYILLYIIHYLLVNKIGCTNWYDSKFFFKMLIISLISVIVFNILYKFNELRYILIIIIGVIIISLFIKFREQIKEVVKTRKIEPIIKIIEEKRKVK